MIKLIIFDADGVLIHAEQFSKQLERKYGITLEQTLPFYTGVFQQCLVGDTDLKTILPPFLTKWGWQKDIDAFLEEWFTHERTIDTALITYIQTVRKKGIICVVGTNQEKYRAEYMLKKMDFQHALDRLYASAHIGVQKPNEKFYSHIIEDFPSIKKDEILFWDDKKHFVTEAKQFGIKAEVYHSFAAFQKIMRKYL